MRFKFVVLALAAPVSIMPGFAGAQVTAEATQPVQVLESRNVPRDVADDVSRVFNAPGTLRLSGTQAIDSGREVTRDIAILDGALHIAGHVTGRVVAINSVVQLSPDAHVTQDVTILGGSFDAQEGGQVEGDVRVYSDHLAVHRETDRIVVQDESEGQPWFRRRNRWDARSWSDLRFVSAHTYSRVEGLPLLIGPAFGREFAWGRVSVDALGVIRSADGFEWKGSNVGHSLKAEVSLGNRGGVRFGGRLFDVVDPVEPWELSDAEVGLASFFLRRDYRDYFDRHGGSVSGAVFLGNGADVTVAYSEEHWGSRDARTPFTLFRGTQDWRPNPQLDVGGFHVLTTTLRYDTRNDVDEPWSGWFLTAEWEHGVGHVETPGPTSDLVRGTGTDPGYHRGFIDLRRYNRVSPDGQLNLRLVLGGWLGGDPLPLERRLSVGGPGSLPGYDFRRIQGPVDYWQCSSATGSGGTGNAPPYPAGVPAQCDRIALAQIEYRGVIHIDPLGILGEERSRRRSGWGRNAEWVVFTDVGRGWLLGRGPGDLWYGTGDVPSLHTFRTDVGFGLRLDDIGIYVAKAVAQGDIPVNFFVRLRPRF